MKAYRLEVRFTVLLAVLLLAAGNIALFFSIFPVEGNLFGFPIMYIIPILSGWFGVLILTVVANNIGNKIDTEIEKANEEEEVRVEKQKKEEGA